MQEEQQNVRSLSDYLEILRRRKRVLLIVLVLLPSAALAASMRQEVLYEAEADVVLLRQNLANILTETAAAPVVDFGRVLQTQASIAESPELAADVARGLRLTDRTPAAVDARTTVNARSDTDLLTFTVRDPDRGVAVRIANEFARQYIDYRQRLETGTITAARADLQGQIRELERRGRGDSRLVATLVEKSQQLQTLETLRGGNAAVATPASSAAQVQPRIIRNVALAIFIALLLGVALALLVEALDTRLRSSDDVEGFLGVPLLGRLTAPPKRLRGGGNLVMTAESSGHRAEAFRALRTNIELATIDRPARTILVTSALEQEGKSPTAANLGFAWALTGRRVVILELDLRRPTQRQLFGIDQPFGLTSVALGAMTLDEALVPIELPDGSHGSANGLDRHGSLEVLQAGPPPPNVGEFVGGTRLQRILEDLRDRADVLIIDSPPMLSVSDALLLSSKVDVIVAIVRLQSAKRKSMREFARLLASAGAPTLGFVLTDAQSDLSFGYGDSYYAYGPRQEKPVVTSAAGQ